LFSAINHSRQNKKNQGESAELKDEGRRMKGCVGFADGFIDWIASSSAFASLRRDSSQ
jgi:hypothetical protein